MSIHQLTSIDILDHEDIHDKIPDLVFLAEAEQETFEPVQIITLQQYYKEKCYDEAWDKVDCIDELELTANRICEEKYAIGREFVEIHKSRVIIGLNEKTITDKEIDKALQLLVSIDDFEAGEKYEFGEDRKIHYEFASKV